VGKFYTDELSIISEVRLRYNWVIMCKYQPFVSFKQCGIRLSCKIYE